ncbi:hypothetical protein [Actinomadura sp.]|jgi:hypothetical protein
MAAIKEAADHHALCELELIEFQGGWENVMDAMLPAPETHSYPLS